MIKLEQKIQNLLKLGQNDKGEQTKASPSILISPPSQLSIETYESSNALTNSLFGAKQFQFKLVLVEEFPSVIYRQRNLHLEVKLATPNGQVLKNDNVINLYLALCDNSGKWIAKNRVGDPMLKGRSQTELCSGEAEFNKVYPQDISRTFLNGTLNVVVYAKSLALVYDSTRPKNSDTIFVDPDLIEPLIIPNVTIMAKKRNL